MLNRIVSALAAVGGAVWTVAETGRLRLEYQINLRETRLAESEEDQVQPRPLAAQGHHQRRRHAGAAALAAPATTKKGATRPTSCWCSAR